MGNDFSVVELVLDASPVVQSVLVLLGIASVASWAVIFAKSRIISKSRRQAEQFETAFWSGGDLGALYRSIETKGRAGTGLQSIFESGFGEFSRLRQLASPSEQLLEGAQRAMRVALLRELSGVERFEPRFAPARLGELARSCLDVTRARDELGWTPTVSIREGLALTLDAGRAASSR